MVGEVHGEQTSNWFALRGGKSQGSLKWASKGRWEFSRGNSMTLSVSPGPKFYSLIHLSASKLHPIKL